MKTSDVYYTDFRAHYECNLLDKLVALVKAAGIATIDFDKKFTAIKISFGEPGNLAYLRPNYAKALADVVKGLGGHPFLTDCNTLYVGRRKHALEHLEAAYENGFNPFQTGCHVLIADGLKGRDTTYVDINQDYIKRARIGTAIMEADVFLSLTHFKGHGSTGFGGALKNIGMGSGSRAGKMHMHSSGIPAVNGDLCIGCGACYKVCGHKAIRFEGKKAVIGQTCVGCGRCIGVCLHDAIESPGDEKNEILNCKIAEYALAVVKDRPHFHVSLVVDVSPLCDCVASNDAPIVPNVGMFASFDPVALDQACADAVNRQQVCSHSALGEAATRGPDHFASLHPDTNWEVGLDHGVKIGLGVQDYCLIEVPLPPLGGEKG